MPPGGGYFYVVPGDGIAFRGRFSEHGISRRAVCALVFRGLFEAMSAAERPLLEEEGSVPHRVAFLNSRELLLAHIDSVSKIQIGTIW